MTPAETYMLSLLGQPPDPAIGPAPEDLLRWLADVAVPLAGTQPGTGVEDLRPLLPLFDGAQVVGLGEATHGTAEFFTLKHRLLELLVQEAGISVVAFEVGFGESLATCDYVCGADNRADAAKALPALWATPEVVALIEWMRAYNARSTGPTLRFYGFDMQSPAGALRAAVAAARAVDPVATAELEPALALLATSFGATYYRATTPSERAASLAALDRLEQLVGGALAAAAPEDREGLRRAYLLTRSAQRAEEFTFTPSQRLRDECMAQAVEDLLILEGPDAKIALWAHNAHIQRGELIELVGGGPVPTMGALLSDRLGPRYQRVSFAFDRGSFRARDLLGTADRTFTVQSAAPHTLDSALAAAGHDVAAFPLHGAPVAGAGADWLAARPGARCIGGASTEELAAASLVRADPRLATDLLLFVADTTAALTTDPIAEPGEPPPAAAEVAGDGTDLAVAQEADSQEAATASRRFPVAGSGERRVVVRGVLSARCGPWPSGAYLLLRYAPQGGVVEQLTRPPYAVTPRPHVDVRNEPVELALTIPEHVVQVDLDLALTGSGTARLQALSLEVTSVEPSAEPALTDGSGAPPQPVGQHVEVGR